MTRRQAVATVHLACLAIGLPAVVLGQLSEERGLLIICQALLVLTLIFFPRGLVPERIDENV